MSTIERDYEPVLCNGFSRVPSVGGRKAVVGERRKVGRT